LSLSPLVHVSPGMPFIKKRFKHFITYLLVRTKQQQEQQHLEMLNLKQLKQRQPYQMFHKCSMTFNGRFYKHFYAGNLQLWLIRWTSFCMLHALAQALVPKTIQLRVHYATAVSYARKSFIKMDHAVVNIIELYFFSLSLMLSRKIQFLYLSIILNLV